eukprot:SAG22_NODE_1_length_62449_cov_158.689270_49_plen_219_part_00
MNDKNLVGRRRRTLVVGEQAKLRSDQSHVASESEEASLAAVERDIDGNDAPCQPREHVIPPARLQPSRVATERHGVGKCKAWHGGSGQVPDLKRHAGIRIRSRVDVCLELTTEPAEVTCRHCADEAARCHLQVYKTIETKTIGEYRRGMVRPAVGAPWARRRGLAWVALRVEKRSISMLSRAGGRMDENAVAQLDEGVWENLPCSRRVSGAIGKYVWR